MQARNNHNIAQSYVIPLKTSHRFQRYNWTWIPRFHRNSVPNPGCAFFCCARFYARRVCCARGECMVPPCRTSQQCHCCRARGCWLKRRNLSCGPHIVFQLILSNYSLYSSFHTLLQFGQVGQIEVVNQEEWLTELMRKKGEKRRKETVLPWAGWAETS